MRLVSSLTNILKNRILKKTLINTKRWLRYYIEIIFFNINLFFINYIRIIIILYTILYIKGVPISNITQQVTFKINSQWNGQFIGKILITNPTDVNLTNWKLQFSFPHEITSIWNASSYIENNVYTLHGEDFNNIIYPHQTISIGFIANYASTINLPQNYALTSDEITISASEAKPLNNISTPCMI